MQARPLLEENAIDKLVDPSIGNFYVDQEVYRMMQCSSMCIRRDPHLRPRVSQVGNLINLHVYNLFIYYSSSSSIFVDWTN